jgi:hypothetical protein
MKNKVIRKVKKFTIKYIMKNYRRNTLTFMVIISAILFSVIGASLTLVRGEKMIIKKDYPILTRVLAPEVYKMNLAEEKKKDKKHKKAKKQGDSIDETTVNAENETTEVQTEPVTEEPVTEYAYAEVGDDYFNDALFIGDSRVEGIKLYGGLKKATFYSKEGISLNKILDEKFVKIKVKEKVKVKEKETEAKKSKKSKKSKKKKSEEETTVAQTEQASEEYVIKTRTKNVNIKKALKQKSFKKIYIMIGINEVGYRTKKEYKNNYKEVIDELRKLQPDAKIFIMGMMKVTNKYQKKHPSFKNKTIDAFNEAVKELADYQTIFYIDMNENILDKNNGVKEKYTWDGVHLKAEYYSVWIDTLKKHGVN